MKYSLALITLFAPFFVEAQVKVGNNPTNISPNSSLETEAANGAKMHINKDNGYMGIGTATPAATLDVKGAPDSATVIDGITAPRLTLAQLKAKDAVYTSAQNGTQVYVTDVSGTTTAKTANITATGLYIFDGVGFVWQKIGTGATSGWSLLGNAGTTAGTNFIGTTDNQNLVFKRNNVLAGLIDSAKGNTSFGLRALINNNTYAFQNTANGNEALYSNTYGSSNTANGAYALYSNTFGNGSTATGYRALYSSTGYENTANGFFVLHATTTGLYNTASGSQALSYNTTGSYNTVNGAFAQRENTTGSYNTADGAAAGRVIANGVTAKTTGDSNVYLGANTKAASNGTNNEIVIGANAIGNGTNSVTLGNDTIRKTILKGNVGIGTISPTTRVDVVATGSDTAGRFTSNAKNALIAQSSTGEALRAESNTNHAIVAQSTYANGVFATSTYSNAIKGNSTASDGIVGSSGNPAYSGVRGESYAGTGVTGSANSGFGVVGSANSGTGVSGTSNTGIGVYARAAGYDKEAIRAQGDNSANGITANAQGGYGIKATSHSSDGIIGIADYAGVGVTGISSSNFGVWGQSTTGMGVYATTGSGDSSVPALLAVRLGSGASSKASAGTFYSYGTGNYLQGGMGGSVGGISNGDFQVIGSLSKSAGTFKIDHPQDPENKYLIHSFVESPDMMNMYNGTIVTDASGFATVALPSYFEAENKEVRYQLTIVGRSFAQAIVAEEVRDNHFVVQTDKPNIKVSWLVMGVRKDAYANAHRVVDEVDKAPQEKGKYLHPELFGQPKEKGIYYIDPATLLPKTATLKTN